MGTLIRDLHLSAATPLQELCRHRAEVIGTLYRDGWIDGWGRRISWFRLPTWHLDAIGGLQCIRNTPIQTSCNVLARLNHLGLLAGTAAGVSTQGISPDWGSAVLRASRRQADRRLRGGAFRPGWQQLLPAAQHHLRHNQPRSASPPPHSGGDAGGPRSRSLGLSGSGSASDPALQGIQCEPGHLRSLLIHG